MKITRRTALTRGTTAVVAAGAASMLPALPAEAVGDDAELLSLHDEYFRLREQAHAIIDEENPLVDAVHARVGLNPGSYGRKLVMG